MPEVIKEANMSSHQEYIDRLKKQLEEWDYELDRLSHRVEDLGQDARQQAKQKLEDAKAYRSEVEGKLKKMEQAAGDALDDLREGVEIAWEGLKTGFYAARSEFEDDKK
jgi:chromosome segregation ATPase